ncbi:MAG: cupin domain-containing protein [Verrucomicrobia bacterium]|nr:cupin domain-containing protein [Verrucomicrobiota bacterium]
MKITSVSQVPLEKVEMPGAEGCAYRVALSSRDGKPSMAMRFFEVAPRGYTPLHQHPYEHEVYITEGAGSVWRDGQEVAIQPGDVLLIPPDEKHQFKNTGKGAFKFMCLIPAQFQKC